MAHTMTIKEAHHRLFDLINEVRETEYPVFLSAQGEDQVALLSIQSYRRLVDLAEREIRRRRALTALPAAAALEETWLAGFSELESLGAIHFSGVSDETFQDEISAALHSDRVYSSFC